MVKEHRDTNRGFKTVKANIGNGRAKLLLDMVHHNPGEPPTKSSFLDPIKLADWGYTGQVFFLFEAGQFGITWDSFDSEVFPRNSDARQWVQKQACHIDKRYDATKKAGLKLYCQMDMIVLPKALVAKYSSQLCDEQGRIDIHKPITQKVIRILIGELFERFPQTDGLVIRTGETYLHDAPHHQGNSPILRGPASHVVLINLLREEVCVKRNKQLIYRTWDFGDFHSIPEYYLEVTSQVETHPKLLFAIKHVQCDFWRMTRFNPCITLGKHRQIIEVQCQREYEGKGAHPNYIAQGIIDGWEEDPYITKPDQPRCLRDIMNHPNFAGIWTWSQGGGWGGPHITNELWCELNAYVVAKWCQDTDLTEEDIFHEFAAKMGFSAPDADRLRQLCLLSANGVLRGHYMITKANDDASWIRDDLVCGFLRAKNGVNVTWTRDDTIGGLDQLQTGTFDHIIKDNKIEQVLAEKSEAVDIWRRIEAISSQLDCRDAKLKEFITVSATYGRIKYEIFEKIWTILLLGCAGDKNGNYDHKTIAKAIASYDQLWDQWRALKESSPSCSTIYRDVYWKLNHPEGQPGVAESVNKYRRILSKVANS